MAPQPLETRFAEVQGCLLQHLSLWRDAPFKVLRPAWCDERPALAEAALGLSDDEVDRLESDPGSLAVWVEDRVPELRGLRQATAVDRQHFEEPEPGHLGWEIPGRKWAQIAAFVAAIGPVRLPVVEWCSGKGHLGRLLASRWVVPVRSLERDPVLCEQGRKLARRAHQRHQVFDVCDVLSIDVTSVLHARHAVALHACGSLHVALVRGAIAAGARALDLAPCCYHLDSETPASGYSGRASAEVPGDIRRLAVTETVTAGQAERQASRLRMAWKLGFLAWVAAGSGESGYLPLKPIPVGCFKGSFEAFCRVLARREGFDATGWPDPSAFEAHGWQELRRVRRLSLPRHALRRAAELWLVLDRALRLEAGGYDVQIREFCPRSVTPRNLLISARR